MSMNIAKIGNSASSAAKPAMHVAATATTPKSVHQAADTMDYGDPVELVKSFDQLPISEQLQHGIYSLGFESPSPIQQKAITPMLQGRDMIMQAQSGTGKTAAFAIGLLHQIDASLRKCQAIVLSPTRELAAQSNKVLSDLAYYMDGIQTCCVMGGTSINDERKMLGRGPQVVSCTPGRLLHHIEHRAISLNKVKVVVLDECDEILSAGFQEQVRTVFERLPGSVQAVIVSATLSADVIAVSTAFLRDPVRILVPVEKVRLEGIKQYYVDCEQADVKVEVLCDLYDHLSISKSIIFCNSCGSAERLAEVLETRDFSVSVIHGGLEQRDRNQRLKDFKNGVTRVLIATDVLSRGIDIQHVNVVVNYELTRDYDDYIHRIGRAGRQGRKGVAINLVCKREYDTMGRLEQHYKHPIAELPGNIAQLME